MARQLSEWLGWFCDLHERARKGLDDEEEARYREARGQLGEMLVLAQRINLKPNEARKQVRVARALQVEFELPTGHASSLTLDVSVGGLSALVAEAPPVGTLVPFRLKLGREIEPVVGHCKVVNVASQQGSSRMSVMFEALDAESIYRVETIVFDVVCSHLRLSKLV